MISFCQDLSISYEYHIYENKTIKKITHTRNGSHLSEKTSVKTNKLSLVSKNTTHNKSLHSGKGISLTDSGKHDSSSPKNRAHHKRHFSNHVEMKVTPPYERKQQEPRIVQKEISFTETHQPKSIELHQIPFHQIVHFNRPQFLHSINPQEKPLIGSTQSPTMPSYSFVQSAKHLNEQPNPFRNCEIHESQTIRINSSIEKLSESTKTKKYDYESKPFQLQNPSQVNSLASYKTLAKLEHSNGKDLETQDDKTSQVREIQMNKDMIFLTPKPMHAKPVFEKGRLNNLEYSFSERKGLEYKIILPENKFNSQNFYCDEMSPLFDAASIVSKTINDEELDDQSLSVVEQRNFFFEKEEEPNQAFKKSIDKFIFFEAGYSSQNNKWIMFRNVQEKNNRKIYSIKEFSSEHEKEYFNEYDVYLSLKAQTSQQYSGRGRNSSINCVFLQLFNALSNNEQKKLHLVKQSFQFMLHDYICHLKKKNIVAIDRIRILVGEKNKLQTEIENVFEFFGSKDISIREDESLEIEDFVICNDLNGNYAVKFHSLHKLQKGYKMHKVLKKQSFVSKNKRTKEKLEELYQKIHATFFFE